MEPRYHRSHKEPGDESIEDIISKEFMVYEKTVYSFVQSSLRKHRY